MTLALFIKVPSSIFLRLLPTINLSFSDSGTAVNKSDSDSVTLFCGLFCSTYFCASKVKNSSFVS